MTEHIRRTRPASSGLPVAAACMTLAWVAGSVGLFLLAEQNAWAQQAPVRSDGEFASGAAERAAVGVDMGGLIQRALDETVDFEVADKTLRETFDVIAAESGIEIRVSDETLDWLPYGSSTRVQGAVMKNASLREGLRRLLDPLGLTAVPEGDHLRIVARPALKRIGRRATWTELETLGWLGSTEWTHQPEQVNRLIEQLQFRVPTESPRDELLARLEQVGTGRADEVLTAACDLNGWTWYPWGDRIAVVEKTAQVMRVLDRPITLMARNAPLADVFVQIARQVDLPIRFAPGALLAVPREATQITLRCVGAPARQSLDAIAGLTGLGFVPRDDGVEVFYAGPEQGATDGHASHDAAYSGDDPVVGRVVLPAEGGAFEYEFLIRESDLPDDVKDLRAKALREAVQSMANADSVVSEPDNP